MNSSQMVALDWVIRKRREKHGINVAEELFVKEQIEEFLRMTSAMEIAKRVAKES